MQNVDIPPLEQPDLDPKTADEIAGKIATEVPQRAYRNYGDCFAYAIQLSLKNEGVSSVTHLLHKKQFTSAELKQFADQAAAVLMNRILNRRRKMIKEGAEIKNTPEYLNNWFFDQDINFFEAVMCDKFDFRKLVIESALAETEAQFTKYEGQYMLQDPGPIRGMDPDTMVDEHERQKSGQ